MRIIVLLSSLYTGGAEFSTLSFYGWLVKKGYSIKLVCYKKATPSYDPAQFGFIEVEIISGNSLLQRLKSLNKVIHEFQPQLIHSVLFEANLLARVCRITNRNFIHLESLVNEMYSDHRLADPRVTKFKLEGYRYLDKLTQRWGVDHFHANGTSVSLHYQQKLGIDPKRITIVPRGRKPNEYVGNASIRNKLRKEWNTGDRLLLVNVGRHEFQKGQEVLLDALSLLDNLDNTQLVIVGREGNFTTALRDAIQKHSLEKNVFLAGHRNDVDAILAAADIFVFPSRFEGLPGALIEAEAAGLPIVCSSITNNLEVVQEGSNALVFVPDDHIQLAAHIQTLARDPKLRSEMGVRSLAIYRQKFQIEDVHEKMERLLQTLMA